MSNKKPTAPVAPKEDAVEAPIATGTIIENAGFEIVDNTNAPDVVVKVAEEAEKDLGNGVLQIDYV